MSPSRTKKTRSSRARTTRGGPSNTTWPATRYGSGGATGAGGGASTVALDFGAARTGAAFDRNSSPRGPERPSRDRRTGAPAPLRGSFLGAAATGCGLLNGGVEFSAKNHAPPAAAAASAHPKTLFFRPTDQKLKRAIAPAQSHREFSLG